MAVREYVGARYVPRFMGTLDPTQIYDALDVVDNGSGTSYIARKTVPAGTPLSDTEFWFVYGASSGAIIQLQNDMITAQNDIGNLQTDMTAAQGAITSLTGSVGAIFDGTFLNNKKVVVYGDSTAVTHNGTSYMKIACKAADATLTNRAVGGSRMNSGADSGVNLINAATDIPTFDYVFLCYGTNEWQDGRQPSVLISDVQAIISAVRSKNATADIIFVNPFFSYKVFADGRTNINSSDMTLENVNAFIQRTLNELGVKYIDFYHRSSCNLSNYTAHLLDDSGGVYVHPNNTFKEELAQIVLQGVKIEKYPILRRTAPLFDSKDFYDAQQAYQNADVTLPGIRGLAMKLTAGVEYYSTVKFVSSGTLRTYMLSGTCDHQITFTLYDLAGGSNIKSYNVNGDFEIYFKPPVGKIKTVFKMQTSTNDTKLTGFNGTVIDAINEDEGLSYCGRPMSIVNIHSDVTYPYDTKGRYASVKNGYMFNLATISVAADVASGTKIFQLDDYFNAKGIFVPIFATALDGSGVRTNKIVELQVIKETGHYYLAPSGKLEAGNYNFYPCVVPIAPNDFVRITV